MYRKKTVLKSGANVNRFSVALLAMLTFAAAAFMPESMLAQTTVHYIFDQVIDENVSDRSGNNHVPRLAMPESSWVSKNGEDGLRFNRTEDSLNIPFAGFPGDHGQMNIRINFDRLTPGQTLWRIHGRGDGMILRLDERNRLLFAYYRRQDKKWFRITCPAKVIESDRWFDVTCLWHAGGNLELKVDGVTRGTAVLAGVKPEWAKDTKMIMGNDVDQKKPFQGVVRSFSLATADDSDSGVITLLRPAPNEIAGLKTVSRNRGDVSFAVDEKYLLLTSLKNTRQNIELLAPPDSAPLWELELVNKDNFQRRLVIDSRITARRSLERTDNGLRLGWENIALPGESQTFSIRADIGWKGESDEIDWRIQVESVPGNWRIFSVSYPCLALQRTNPVPEKNFLAWPYRWGRLSRNPFDRATRFGSAYPGTMHFQFCFLYGENQPGLYLATHDAAGYYKTLLWDADSSKTFLVQRLEMVPEQRGISGSFEQPYPVITAIMDGDWYDAARKYREWAIRQHWCANGRIAVNKEIPEWYKNTSTAMKWSTERLSRTIPTNVRNTEWITDKFGTPSLGVWYHYRGNWESEDSVGVKNKWFGCTWNAREDAHIFPGVIDTVKLMRERNVYLIGYLNSRIYDQSLDESHAETQAVIPHTMKKHDGSIELYSNTFYEGCRHDPWWQEHLLKYCREGVEKIGFHGMYLDSYGRGQYFCYGDNHGHLPGCSRASIAGMRQMGNKIKQSLREINPDIIISSEASIEQFIDIVDAKLLHFNIYAEACPIWQVLYHDYQLTFGRSVYPANDSNSLQNGRIIAASTLHIGAQIGRFRPDGRCADDYFGTNPVGKAIAEMLDTMLIIRNAYLPLLGWGEMLRAAKVAPDTVVKSTVGRFDVEVPAVFTSSWRDHDNNVGIFFTNITETDKLFTLEFNPDEYGIGKRSALLVRAGKDKKTSSSPVSISDAITLAPGETAGLIFK